LAVARYRKQEYSGFATSYVGFIADNLRRGFEPCRGARSGPAFGYTQLE
jgi:hypothetical protein